MKAVELFFDFASPYSYLASERLPELCARHGAALRWRPMVLSAVFEAAGNRMPATSPPKARWMLGDLERWSAHEGIPFAMNRRWPLNTIPTMRLALVAEEHGRAGELCRAAFRRFWQRDEDITQPTDLAELAAEAGLPATAVARIGDPAIKAALKANSDEAAARGVFGAPAMFVGDALFWGNDRLHFVEAALRA